MNFEVKKIYKLCRKSMLHFLNDIFGPMNVYLNYYFFQSLKLDMLKLMEISVKK